MMAFSTRNDGGEARYALHYLALLTFVALASCSGGGSSPHGGPTPAPTATPTPSQTCAPASARRAGGGRLAESSAGQSAWVVPDRLYVTYRAPAAARVAQSVDTMVHAVRGVEIGVPTSGLGHRAITLPPGSDADAVAVTLRRNPDVVGVARIHYRRLALTSGSDAVNDLLSDNVNQWYLYITNVNPGAWTTTTGSSSISLAVIDTGVDETNPDFSSKFVFRESVVGGVVKTGAGSAQDTNGHGTNVAGLAAAQANNGYGYAGYGYNTSLQAYKIFPDATATSDCQMADTADEARAIRDAVAHGASVINLSLGSPQSQGADPAEQSAVEFAISSNVTVVAAAGNEYPTSDGNQPDFPAAYPGVIAVGATGVKDDNTAPGNYSSITAETIASYSNSGPTLVAPGGDASGTSDGDLLHWIEGYDTTTAKFPPDQCTPQTSQNICAALFNGTSQATPQVTGTVALMMAFHGGARSLTPAQVTSLLTANADAISGISSTRQGAGRLDAAKAVSAAFP